MCSNNKLHSTTFEVSKDFIHYVFEADNLRKVRQLQGITNVTYHHGKFEIQGESTEIIKIARSLLDYCERVYVYKRVFIDNLLARDGELLKHIVDTTGLICIMVNEKHPDPNKAILTLKGIIPSVEEAECELKKLEPVYSFSNLLKKSNNKNYKFGTNVTVQENTVGTGSNTTRKNNKIKIRSSPTELQLKEDRSMKINEKDVGRAIGKCGIAIKEITQKSEVRKIHIDDHGNVTILGFPRQIQIAKLLLKDVCNK